MIPLACAAASPSATAMPNSIAFRQGSADWVQPGLKGNLKTLERDVRSLGEHDAYLAQKINFLLDATLDLSDVLNTVMDTVIQLTGAERGYLMLRNSETKEMEFRVARNIEQRSLNEDEFIVSSGVVSEVAQTGLPVVTNNAIRDPRFGQRESVMVNALRSILCVPLMLKGEVTGVVYADNRLKSGLFGNKELQLLYAFANQAAFLERLDPFLERFARRIQLCVEVRNKLG